MITSPSNEKIIELSKLHLKKVRDVQKLALVDGEHLIEEAYHANVLTHIYGLHENPPYRDIPYTQVSESVMRKLCATTSLSPLLGVVKIIEAQPLLDTILVLDGVQDPGNIGTLLRSALAFDFKSIILLPGCADPYGSKAMAASQGALFKCHIHPMSVQQFQDLVFHASYDVIVSQVTQASSIQDLKIKPQTMLVLGSEGAGVSEPIKALATQFVCINTNHVESLNVAMAGSILMHALFSLKG